jgi:hypothetical protein
MMKNYFASNLLFVLFMLCLFCFYTTSAKLINKSFKTDKSFENRKFPQPQKNPKMNYFSCCCFTELGYYGWVQEILKSEEIYCINSFSCVDEAFIEDCPTAD